MNARLEDALEYVTDHLRERITLRALARRVGVTPQHLSFLFRTDVGTTFSQWVQSLRMQKAKRLLESTNAAVKEVMVEVGVRNASSFSRLFKQNYRVSPSLYRARSWQGRRAGRGFPQMKS